MAVDVLFLCVLLSGSLSGFILPSTMPLGTDDMSTLKTQVFLLGQTMDTFQATTTQLRTDVQATKADLLGTRTDLRNVQAQLQTALSDLQTCKTQQGNAAVEISSLKTQMSSLNTNTSGVATQIPKVAFQAHDPPSHTNAAEPLKFKYVNHNAGSGYDYNTGKFTAPVTGTYLFWAQLEMGGGSNTAMYVYIKKSGAVNMATGYMETGSSFGDVDASAEAVDHLDQRQEVWVEITTSYNIYHSASYFGGALLSVG